jgi:hypothetical protein
MHVHMNPASGGANALSSAQSAETAAALRRARELREAASRLKSDSLDISPDGTTNPETVAMIAAWAGESSAPRQSMQNPPGSDSEPSKIFTRAEKIQLSSSPVSFWA